MPRADDFGSSLEMTTPRLQPDANRLATSAHPTLNHRGRLRCASVECECG